MKLRSASLQAVHAGLLALAMAGAIPYGWHAVWSLALAGGIQVLNLAVLERSVRLVVAGHGSAPIARMFFMLRLVLVLGAVLLALGPLGVAPRAVRRRTPARDSGRVLARPRPGRTPS